MLEKRSFYINGSWVAPLEGATIQLSTHLLNRQMAVISLGGQQDTDAAVAAARAAFPTWMNTPAAARIELVEKLLEQYNQRRAALAEAVSLEMGAPIDMAHNEQIAAGASHITNFLKAAKTSSLTGHWAIMPPKPAYFMNLSGSARSLRRGTGQ